MKKHRFFFKLDMNGLLSKALMQRRYFFNLLLNMFAEFCCMFKKMLMSLVIFVCVLGAAQIVS